MGENNKRPVELIIIAAICIAALLGMISVMLQLKHDGGHQPTGITSTK